MKNKQTNEVYSVKNVVSNWTQVYVCIVCMCVGMFICTCV